VQDYRPGQAGIQQHVWQATFGPDAVVFVTHPPCLSEDNSHRPGFWHGNVILPRVAQWKDVLLAIHRLPADDWLGFTHAYFPAWSFDEYVLRDSIPQTVIASEAKQSPSGGRELVSSHSTLLAMTTERLQSGQEAGGRTWAFARKGDGYLALTASCGLDFMTRGDNAYRELRSYGHHNIWLCHLGRAALDGDFAAFQDKMLTLAVSFDGLAVRCTTLRGETLSFGWEGPLLRNGQVEPITGFKHYDNPYCVADLPATEMDVRYGELTMRLKFAAG
jgi:hypothetical protein